MKKPENEEEMQMYSSMIGKIEKAKRYSQERERATFSQFRVNFRGEHDNYNVTYDAGQWACGCHYFAGHGLCSHTMALQRMLEGMLPAEQVTSSLR